MGRRTYDQGDKVDRLVNSPCKVEHFVLTRDDPEQVAKGEIALTFVTTIK